MEEISNLLESLATESHDSEPLARWEWIKFRVRSKTIEFEKEKNRLIRREEKELNSRLDSLTKAADSGAQVSKDEIESVRRELSELELARAQRIIFRSRANYARYGEKTSRF